MMKNMIIDIHFDVNNGYFQLIPLDKDGAFISCVQSFDLLTGKGIRLKTRPDGRVIFSNGEVQEETVEVFGVEIIYHPNGDYRSEEREGVLNYPV
jgi:hypothetical protein